MRPLHFLLTLLIATASSAATEELARATQAADVINMIGKVPEQAIPDWLLSDAEAVAVIPQMVKAGLVIGGRRGKGLLSVRASDGSWSAPTYVTMTGGSIGFQAGVQKTDVILVFKTRRSIEMVVNGTFTLGGDASVAAGPVGREASAATDNWLQSEIYSYSRSRGLFAGVALDGSAIRIDHNANQAVYGDSANSRKIFAGQVRYPDGQAPDAIIDFRDALEEQTNR